MTIIDGNQFLNSFFDIAINIKPNIPNIKIIIPKIFKMLDFFLCNIIYLYQSGKSVMNCLRCSLPSVGYSLSVIIHKVRSFLFFMLFFMLFFIDKLFI